MWALDLSCDRGSSHIAASLQVQCHGSCGSWASVSLPGSPCSGSAGHTAGREVVQRAVKFASQEHSGLRVYYGEAARPAASAFVTPPDFQ